MNWEITLLATLGLLAWFWWDSLQKREIAIRAARLACERAGMQLLDDSVAQIKLRLAKDDNQRSRLYREYAFEFSDSGDRRLAGRVYLLGARLIDVNLILPAAAEPPAATIGTVVPFPDRRE